MAYVSASEIEIMPIASTVTQYATKDGATVIFYFSYSDGNSATFLDIAYDKSKYNILSGPTSSFSGDTRYASVTLFDSSNITVLNRAALEICVALFACQFLLIYAIVYNHRY